MDSIEQFEKVKANFMRQYELSVERLRKVEEKYTSIANDEKIDKKEQRLALQQKQINIRKHAVELLADTMEFLRPESKDDVEYRLRQDKEFSKKIREVLPDDLHLCFHGCPIYAAKHIIEDGEISSSVDRIGSETSYDVSDQVSVTTKNSIDVTVNGYTGLTGNYNLPAGCIFVILPKDEQEIESSEQSMLIGNVSFKEKPDRLYAIITTPENIEQVSKWAEKSGIDLSKIHDFDGFVQEMTLQKTNEDKRQDTELGVNQQSVGSIEDKLMESYQNVGITQEDLTYATQIVSRTKTREQSPDKNDSRNQTNNYGDR